MKLRVFKHYVPVNLLVLASVEFLILMTAIYSGLFIRWADTSKFLHSLHRYFPEVVIFSSVIIVINFAVGLYHKDYYRDYRVVFIRLLFSFAVSLVVLSVVFYIFPTLTIWRSAFAIGAGLGLVGVLAARALFLRAADRSAFERRILVLGAGAWAKRIAELERDGHKQGFSCVGFIPMGSGAPAIDESRILTGINSLSDFVRENDIEEVVVAVEERRGGLPIEALLACKFEGVSVTEYETFWERETGRVDLDALHPSWLVFSDGFVGGRLHSSLKRTVDIVASLVLLVFSLPVLIVTAIAVRVDSPGPILFRQERVGLNGRPFMLLKFRSMRPDAEREGTPRWAAANDERVTRVGGFIRMSRIDELPQIFNVLKGDMSFIGPRPERPFFVEELTAKIPYYAARHRVKPGISGWAQLNYPYGASIEDAREKLQYDLYYIKNYSVFLDIVVLLQTVRVILWPVGAR